MNTFYTNKNKTSQPAKIPYPKIKKYRYPQYNKQTNDQRTTKKRNFYQRRVKRPGLVGNIQPKSFSEKEYKIWVMLANRFGLLVLFLVLLKFVTAQHVLYGYTFWIICYLNVLRYQVVQREFLRWHNRYQVERHGGIWILVWPVVLILMLMIVRLLPDGITIYGIHIHKFVFPRIEVLVIVGVIAGQYVSTISSVRRYIRQQAEEDFNNPPGFIHKIIHIAEALVGLVKYYFCQAGRVMEVVWQKRYLIWVRTTDSLGVIVMGAVLYKFYTTREIWGYSVWIMMYLALLSFTVNQKEFRVWRNEHPGKRYGEVWVGVWIAAFVFMQVMATYFPHGYQFPEVEIFIITGITFGHYLTTLITRSKFNRIAVSARL